MGVLKQKIPKLEWSPSMSWCLGQQTSRPKSVLKSCSYQLFCLAEAAQGHRGADWQLGKASTNISRQAALGGQENRVPRFCPLQCKSDPCSQKFETESAQVFSSASVGQIPANRSLALQGWMMGRTSHGRCWSGSMSASASASWRPTRTMCPRCRRWRSSSWARNRWVPSAVPWATGRAGQQNCAAPQYTLDHEWQREETVKVIPYKRFT